MYRRLTAWSMTIASVAALAFLIPLGLNVRQYQQDIAMVRAQQEAREISSYATFVGDASRLQSTLRTLGYDGTSPNRITVWYPDGRALSVTDIEAGPGTMPASVRSLLDGAGVIRPTEQRLDGGRELLWPAPLADGSRTVIQVVVPESVLDAQVTEKWLWLASVAAAIVLAAGAVANRLGRHLLPPGRTRSGDPQPIT